MPTTGLIAAAAPGLHIHVVQREEETKPWSNSRNVKGERDKPRKRVEQGRLVRSPWVKRTGLLRIACTGLVTGGEAPKHFHVPKKSYPRGTK